MDNRVPKATTNLSPSELLNVRGVIELLLAATAFIVYAGTLAFNFVYDDRAQVLDNKIITSWSYVPGYFAHHVWFLIDPHVVANYYRPVFLLWLKINYSLFGLSPAWWHLSSVALHIIATLQVFWLGQRLLKNRTGAAIASLLFAVHPVHVESVAWVSGVTDLLMFVTMLGAVLGFLRWQQTRTLTSYVAALAFAALAFLSKEPAIVLPLLIVVSAWAAIPSDAKLSSSERRALLPFFVLAVAYFALRQHIVQGFSHNMDNASVREMVLTWPTVIVFYLRQLFLPYELSLFHSVPWVETPFSARFVIPLATIVAVIAGMYMAVRASNERRTLLAAFAWMAIPLVPVMYLRVYMEGEIVHDRYTYVASVGLVFVLILLAQMLLKYVPEADRFSRARVVAAAFVMVFAALTVYNQLDWASDLLLFSHALKVSPNSNVAMLDLGTIYAEKGDPESLNIAKKFFVRVTANSKQNAAAYFNLGHAEYQLGDYSNAEKHLFRAIQLDTQYGYWWMNFATVELRLSKYVEAEAAAREAIRYSPEEPGYHAALGAILLSAHKSSEAEQEFNYELKIHPGNKDARKGLATLAAMRAATTQAGATTP
jgi:protein O-mannosyl-transferase